MKPNMKKAIIDQIMLGFVLFSMLFVFVATVSDELKVRNKYANLKKLVQTAVLSASKYYINESQNTTEAQNIALGIVEQSALGATIKDDIEFTWDFISDPNNVKAKIENYEEEMFWYKLLDWDSYTFDIIEAKANIVTPTTASDFLPIAVNGCSQDLTVGSEFEFLLKAFDTYTTDDNAGFYALSLPGGGQSSFTEFKNNIANLVGGGNNNFNMDDDDFYIDGDVVTVATVESADINNDVKQISQSFNMTTFVPQVMSIAVLDCDSSAENPSLDKLLQVKVTSVGCASTCCIVMPFVGTVCGMPCIINDMLSLTTNNDLSNITWASGHSSCNSNGLFGIHLEILNNETVVLEY